MDKSNGRGIKKEHFYYYLDGGVAEHVAISKLGHTIVDDKFDPGEKPRSLRWTEGDISRRIEIDEKGEILSYQWYDYKREISVSKNYNHADKGRVNIKVPPLAGNIYTFDLKRHDIEITGRFWWDTENKVNVLEDNIGTYQQLNRKEIAYPPQLPCNCKEWEKSDFFALPTSEFIKEEKFKKYQFNFHAPISLKGIYGDPYYMKEQPKKHLPGKKYAIYSHFITREAITFYLPDTYGLSFSLAPCRSKHAFVNQSISAKFRIGHPDQTELSFSKLKSLELAFPTPILRQVNENFEVLKDIHNNDIPGSFLFTSKRVSYNKEKELDVVEPRFVCSRPMEIMHSKLMLEVHSFLPDLSTTENYSEMNHLGLWTVSIWTLV